MARKMSAPVAPEVQAQRRRKAILIGCGAAVLLALVAAIVIYSMLTGGPRLPRDITRRLEQQKRTQTQPPATPGAPTAPGPQAPRDLPPGTPPLPQQLQQLEQARRSGSTASQTLYLTEAELNQMMGSHGPSSSIKEMNAYFDRDQVLITATGNWHGRDLTVTMTAKPVIVNGGVQFVVEEVRLGSFPAPSAVVERVQKEVQRKKDKLSPAQTGLYVDSVEIKPGVAILTGRPVVKR